MRRARGSLSKKEAYCIARLGYTTSIVSFQKKSRSHLPRKVCSLFDIEPVSKSLASDPFTPVVGSVLYRANGYTCGLVLI